MMHRIICLISKPRGHLTDAPLGLVKGELMPKTVCHKSLASGHRRPGDAVEIKSELGVLIKGMRMRHALARLRKQVVFRKSQERIGLVGQRAG
jgi:hypothetical protein